MSFVVSNDFLFFVVIALALVIFISALATMWEIIFNRWEARNEEVLLLILAMAFASAAFGVLRALVMEVL